MKKMNEREIEEIEALNHYIKYLKLNPDVKDFELWDGVQRLEKLGQRIISGEINEKEVDKILDLNDMKELIENFMNMLIKRVQQEEGN